MRERGDPSGDLPYAAVPGGVRLAVRLTPRAGRAGLAGIVRGADGRPALRLLVAAPPVEGAANAALIAYVAKALGLPKSTVRIAAGAKGRTKLLDLSGDADRLAARLAAWIAAAGAGPA